MAKFFVQLEQANTQAPLAGSRVINHVIDGDLADLLFQISDQNPNVSFTIIHCDKISNSAFNRLKSAWEFVLVT